MSPSETKGRALGIDLVQFDRSHRYIAVAAGPVRGRELIKHTHVARFRVEHGGRRHELVTGAKSRAGAWRVAVRWLKGLQKGKL